MGVVRLSGSGLQVQFVDDEGNVFVTSKKFLLGFLGRGVVGVPLFLGRLPFSLSPKRYGRSVVVGGDALSGGGVSVLLGGSEGRGVDVSGSLQLEKKALGDLVDLSVEVDL